jgi:hypothetical protein
MCNGDGSPVSTEESNKALVRKFFEEAWVKGNVAAVDEFMAADYFEHPRPSKLPPGTEGLKRLIANFGDISFNHTKIYLFRCESGFLRQQRSNVEP